MSEQAENNLKLWEQVKSVPETAKKPITGGRLNGYTDINPMWRIKTLTEQFGQCGRGWRYEITDRRMSKGAGSEIAAFVDINLYVNDPGTGWSEPIPGTGGSMFVTQEKTTLHTSDECYKMALTDAIGVACKALGVGADVYWSKDTSKYPTGPPASAQAPTQAPVTDRDAGQRSPSPNAGTMMINFGKHNGRSIAEIYVNDPGYIEWLADAGKNANVKASCQAYLNLVTGSSQTKEEPEYNDRDDAPNMFSDDDTQLPFDI